MTLYPEENVMNDAQALDTITKLSREFGTDTYVRGGGGNTSYKNADTLFVKPSGVTLGEMTPESFLPLDRKIMAGLFTTAFPADDKGREAAVVQFMASTVREGHTGRPSVEAPLHDTFPQRFVVHTHPAEVNGLTCGNDSAMDCAKLFPKSLWVAFAEPGYTLCMRIREAMAGYSKEFGHAPEIVFLENHGVFIAHDEADGIRNLYEQVMYGVRSRIADAGLNSLPKKGPVPTKAAVEAFVGKVRGVMGAEAAAFACDGRFDVPKGPISPDHIVYCKTNLFTEPATPEALTAFKDRYGYWPRVVATQDAVFGFGPTRKVADLALELAWDGAVVAHYAGAFGGIHFLEKHFADFIENWEVESYRRKMAE